MPLTSQFPAARQERTQRHFMEPSTMALWTGVLLALLLVVTASWRALGEYEHEAEHELALDELLSQVLQEQATQHLDTAAGVLANLAEMAGSGQATDPALQEGMAQALVSMPILRSISLLDAGGTVLAGTRRADVGRTVNLALLRPDGAPHLAQQYAMLGTWRPGRHLGDLGAGGAPGAPDGIGMIPYTLTLNNGSGRRLVALVNPEGMLGFEQLRLDGTGRISVLTTYEGRVLTTAMGGTPASGAYVPGGILSGHAVLDRSARRHSSGSLMATGLGGKSFMGYSASRNQPLVVIVERPTFVVRDIWLRGLVPLFIISIGGLCVICAMTWATWRSLHGRERALNELKAQLDLTGLLLEISPVPISMLDREERYMAVNKAWEGFMCRTREEVLGQPSSRWMSDEEARIHEGHDALLLAHGGKLRYEAVVPHADGTQRTLLINKVAVPGKTGRTESILCAFVDITEFRAAEQATRVARDAAEKASLVKSEFIANISHELRTPLQAIIGFSEIGMTRASTPERTATMFNHIHASGQRMLALVNDLLDVSKIESSVGTFNLAPCDLRELVRAVVTELTPLLQRQGHRAQLQLPPDTLLARADSLRFQQVVRNVMANAIRFSPPGQPIEVDVTHAGEGRCRVTVRDHGPGIPEAELQDIFDAFIQSSRTKDGSGGTGLGLAICRKIMDAHGGTIHAENAPGGGARIVIELPAA